MTTGIQASGGLSDLSGDSPKRFVETSHSAFVALITGSSYDTTYLKGLQALASSLLDTGTRFPFFVVTTEEPTVELQKTISCLGMQHLRVPIVRNPYSTQPRYETVMTKLAIWALPIKRIVFLDLDTVVLKNIDELFSGTVPFQAAANCGQICSYKSFNSGVLVIAPSNTTYRLLLKELGKIPANDGADQGFLNTFFQNEWRNTALRLPNIFNTFRSRETHEGINLKAVRVLHNVGMKPWQSPNDYLNYPVSMGLFHKAISSWEAKRRQCSNQNLLNAGLVQNLFEDSTSHQLDLETTWHKSMCDARPECRSVESENGWPVLMLKKHF
jgi:lipopolysaccharide biosynthesis glycosyltransferase